MLELNTSRHHKKKIHPLLRAYRTILVLVVILVALLGLGEFAYGWYNNMYAGSPTTVVTYKLAGPTKKPPTPKVIPAPTPRSTAVTPTPAAR